MRESLREREILLKIAPHLVKPLPLLIPIYNRSRRGPWTIAPALMAYDLLRWERPCRITKCSGAQRLCSELRDSTLPG